MITGTGDHLRPVRPITITGMRSPAPLVLVADILAAAPARPRPAYDRIARNRYRLFGRNEGCLVPTSSIAARFVLDDPSSSCSANAKRMRSVLPDPEVEIPAARLQSAAFLRSSRARPLVSQCWVGGFKARREVPLTRDAGPMRGEFEDSRQSGPECRAADTHHRWLAYSRH